jgi:hypothetical protein
VSYYLLDPRGTGPVDQLELHCTKIRWAGIPLLSESQLLDGRERSGDVWVSSRAHRCVQAALQYGLSGRLHEMKPTDRDLLARCTDDLEFVTSLEEVLGDERLAAQLASNSDQEDAYPARRRLQAAFLRRARSRLGTGEVLRALTAAAMTKITKRLRARCGVALRLHPRGPDAESVRLLLAPMFLRSRAVCLKAGDFPGLKRCTVILNEAGLLLGVEPASGRRSAAASPLFAGAPLLTRNASDEAIKQAAVDRFVLQHRLL